MAQIKANHKAKVLEILGGTNLLDKLMNMGVYKGKEVTKLSHIGLRQIPGHLCWPHDHRAL